MGEQAPRDSSSPEQKTIEQEQFWQKAEAALVELRNIDNLDDGHLANVMRMNTALQKKDNHSFAVLAANEWVRFEGSLHAQFYELPAVEDFLACAAKLEKWDSPD